MHEDLYPNYFNQLHHSILRNEEVIVNLVFFDWGAEKH
jgi:hypothetical protein